jgi:universal stress protein A
MSDGSIVFALTRILVPTNLGEPSRTAIQYGVAFARQFGAKLYLLHVLDAKDLDAALETERVLEVLSAEPTEAKEPSPLELAHNAARHDLGRLLALDDERATRAEYLLRASGMAGAGEAILACARELDVELIVMGKHHLGFVEHLLAGSVAEKVVRHAPCPVLIVQHPVGVGTSERLRHFVLADTLHETTRTDLAL